jgi:dTDP-4-amino-4,6-dideoxygalactose transaminase
MHQDQPIPFNRAAIEGNELAYIQQALERGHTSSGGEFVKRAEEILLAEFSAQDVLLTTSCTSALELTALMLDLQPGDTVIVPSFTFTTTALAFVRQGAKIKFCDIEPVTLGLDTEHLKSLLDETVRAVVPVHYAGVACDIDGMRKALVDWPDVAVIEDNAHGLFGRWNGQPLGTLGRFATQSFHDTKNIVCGEGGALVVNETGDVDRVRVLYEKGTNRRAFFLGQVDKYSWKDTGSSFALANVLAAYLTAQLEKADMIQDKRRTVFERYEQALAPRVEELGIRLPVVPEHCEQTYHMFYVLLPDRPTRDAVLSGMREQDIAPTFHYVPLHSSEAGRKFSAAYAECPVSDDISGRLIRLPFYNNLTEAESERVIDSFVSVLSAARSS